jgi:hypothetical protein
MRGTLESAPDHKFQLHVKHGDRVYARTLKGTGPKIVIRGPLEVARENKVKDLKKARSTLFNAAQGGAAEGSFEYVASYLFGEVFGTDPEAAQKMWDEVWEVRDVARGAGKAVPRNRQRRALRATRCGARWREIHGQQFTGGGSGRAAIGDA